MIMNAFEIARKLAVIAVLIVFASGSPASAGLDSIRLPPGFKIEYYSTAVPGARSMALGEDNTVYVGTFSQGRVYALPDADRNGQADRVVTIAAGLTIPNGIAVIGDSLYVAEVSRIIRFEGIDSKLDNPPAPVVVFDRLPDDLHHGAKYLALGPDGYFYLGVGAPCNICSPDQAVYASIVRVKPNGEGFEIYAHGIRNSVGFDWHPLSHEMFFTDNGRDWLGDDKPPEELNHAPNIGLHFGFPFCHAGSIPDPEFGDQKNCADYKAPAWELPAHVAPLGVHFYIGEQFPKEYKNQLFVAEHGSWNRSVPSGYRIEVLSFKDSKPVSSKVFAEGWLSPEGKVSGRPVDFLQLKDGSLLVSDDHRGAIYRISYQVNKSEANPIKNSTSAH